jgi:hypothetical protein
MMTNKEEFEKRARIVVFRNDTDNEKAPDFTGRIELDDALVEAIKNGESELRLSMWKSQSESGVRYWSGSVQTPYKKEEEAKPAKSKPKAAKVAADDDEW